MTGGLVLPLCNVQTSSSYREPHPTERRTHRRACLFTRVPLEIAMWAVHGEPVPAERACKAKYKPFSVGEMWGALWDTVWFRFQGEVPREWKAQEVVALVQLTSLGGEGFSAEGAIYQNGRLVRAISLNRREVEITARAKGGEPFTFFVEAAANGGMSLQGLNLPDYNGTPLFRLEQAELACRNAAIFNFYYDFKFATEAMDALPENSQRRAELRYALNETVNEFDPIDPSSIKRAAATLREVMRRRNGDTVHTLSAVGHAHIDTAWLWPLRETIRKCARTFSTALNYMQNYPGYVFVCSQAQHYAWMKAGPIPKSGTA